MNPKNMTPAEQQQEMEAHKMPSVRQGHQILNSRHSISICQLTTREA